MFELVNKGTGDATGSLSVGFVFTGGYCGESIDHTYTAQVEADIGPGQRQDIPSHLSSPLADQDVPDKDKCMPGMLKIIYFLS